jgi:U3 small nucleolar RNA-associated protein 14
MKQNVKKWLPIIKKNRESDKIDFTKVRNIPTTRVNTNASLKHNPIA